MEIFLPFSDFFLSPLRGKREGVEKEIRGEDGVKVLIGTTAIGWACATNPICYQGRGPCYLSTERLGIRVGLKWSLNEINGIRGNFHFPHFCI